MVFPASLLPPASTSYAQSARPGEATEDERGTSEDVRRAKDSGGHSPDRLVVVYDAPLAEDDPARQDVRRAAGGTLLSADRVLRRDVIRIPNGDAAAVALRLKKLSRVREAYPDRVAHAAYIPNDPLLADEWGLATIGATTAWDTSRGAGVTVAVLDCGVHVGHPDLAGQVAFERNFTSTGSTDV